MGKSIITIAAIIIICLLALGWLSILAEALFYRLFKKQLTSYEDTVLLRFDNTKARIIAIIIVLLSLTLVLVDSSSLKGLLGINRLDSSISGTYCFYVEAKDQETGVTYTLPAQVKILNDSDPEFGTTYYVDRFYFDDNTFCEFPTGDYFELNDTDVHMTDQNGKEWECTLINKRAFNSNIHESKGYTTGGIIEVLLFIISALYNVIGCAYCKEGWVTQHNRIS